MPKKDHDPSPGEPQPSSQTGPSMPALGEKKIRHTNTTDGVDPEPADGPDEADPAIDRRDHLYENEPPKTKKK